MFLKSNLGYHLKNILIFIPFFYAFFTLLGCSNDTVTPKLADIPLHSNKKYVSIESIQAELGAEALRLKTQKNSLLKD